jgi:hypothetical protein
VHVRGDLGPLLRADALAALRAEVAGQPQHPRSAQHEHADDHDDRRQQPLPRLLQLAAGGQEAEQPDHHQGRPDEDDHRAADPARAPALALRLVGLPPHQRHAPSGGEQREQRR